MITTAFGQGQSGLWVLLSYTPEGAGEKAGAKSKAERRVPVTPITALKVSRFRVILIV